MRPGCCCTPKAKVSTLSQATSHLQPTFILVSPSPPQSDITRRYVGDTPLLPIHLWPLFVSDIGVPEPAMAAPASIGHSRIRYCKCRARLGPGAGRSPLVSWSRISVSGHMPPAEDGARCTHCFRWASLHIAWHFLVVNVPNSGI